MNAVRTCQILSLSLFFVCLELLSGHAVAYGHPETDGPEYLRMSAKSHSADWETWKQCCGTGQMVWISSNQQYTYTCDVEFEVSDGKLWQLMTTRSQEPAGLRDVDKVEILADGDVIANVDWGARFRPHGCQVYARKDEYLQEPLFAAASGFRVDLRRDISPKMLRKVPTTSPRTVRTTEVETDNDEKVVVLVSFPNANQQYRYFLSKEFGFRLVRFEQFDGRSNPLRVFEYEWADVEGIVRPRTITLEMFESRSENKGYSMHIVSLDKLSAKPSGRKFTMSELTVCEGARLIDHRDGALAPVRTFAEVTEEVKSVSEEISQMPERRGDKMPVPAAVITPSSSGTGRILVYLNLAFLLLGGGVWLYKYRGKKV